MPKLLLPLSICIAVLIWSSNEYLFFGCSKAINLPWQREERNKIFREIAEEAKPLQVVFLLRDVYYYQ